MAKSCFDVQKDDFLKELDAFFGAILSEMDLDHVGTWEV